MKPRVILHIDTSHTEHIRVVLTIEDEKFEKISKSHIHRAQAVLPLITSLLEDHQLTLADITEITVNIGPGSFTGLRVGCTVANALGYLLDVPVNGKRTLANPTYS